MPAVPSRRTVSTRPASSVRKRVGQPELVIEIGGAAVGAGGAEQAAGVAGGVDLLVVELRADRADQGAERRRHRHEL